MINALDDGAAQEGDPRRLDKTGNNNLTEALKDNVVLDYAGVRAAELTDAAAAAAARR